MTRAMVKAIAPACHLLDFALLRWVDNHDFAFPFHESPQAWREILTRIRTDFPFFNRSNGADHFSVLTMDHGRCSSLTFLPPALYGEMFFLQINGDKLVRSNDIGNYRNLQVSPTFFGSNYEARGGYDEGLPKAFLKKKGYFSALACSQIWSLLYGCRLIDCTPPHNASVYQCPFKVPYSL